jgi:hypothetical protein
MRYSGGKNHIKDYLINGKVLRHFLEKNVGRVWDAVFSEICQFADRRTELGHGIHRDLEWMVEQDRCYLGDDGKVYVRSTRHSRGDYLVDGLYVHPSTGVLSYALRQKFVRKTPPLEKLDYIETPDGKFFDRENGIWYEITRTKLKLETIIFGEVLYHGYETKRQLNTKEIKGLKKDLLRQYGTVKKETSEDRRSKLYWSRNHHRYKWSEVKN